MYMKKNMHNFKNVEIPLDLWLYVTFYIFIQTSLIQNFGYLNKFHIFFIKKGTQYFGIYGVI